MQLKIEVEQEEDGRWIAEATAIPGVLAYGETPEKAIAAAAELARKVLAEREEHDE
jgi:predicted RNase H-like HicB family nuclease